MMPRTRHFIAFLVLSSFLVGCLGAAPPRGASAPRLSVAERSNGNLASLRLSAQPVPAEAPTPGDPFGGPPSQPTPPPGTATRTSTATLSRTSTPTRSTPATPTRTPPLDQSAMYDLYVRRMDFSPADMVVGETITLHIMIATDTHPSGSPLFPALHFRWRKGPGFAWEEEDCPASSQYAACTTVVTFSYAQPGEYLVEVEADSRKEVAEADETNNVRSWNITVRAATITRTPTRTPTMTGTPPTPTSTPTPTPTVPTATLPSGITLITTINVGKQPGGLTMNSGWNRLYVANFLDDKVSVIDGATNQITSTISAVGDSPQGLALDVTGRLFATNYLSNTVTITGDGRPETLTVGRKPKGIVSLDSKVYVANSDEKTVSVFARVPSQTIWGIALTWKTQYTITVGTEPSSLAADVSRGRIYVTNRRDNNVSVIDTSRNVVTATIAVGGEPYGIAINPETNRIYTANRQGKSVSVIDGNTFKVVQTIPLEGAVYTVAVNPDTSHLFAVTADTRRVWVVREDGQVLGAVPIGRGATEGIAFNPATDRVYIANGADNTITVIQDKPVLKEVKAGNLLVRADLFATQSDGQIKATGNIQVGDYLGVSPDGAVLIDQKNNALTGSGKIFLRTAGQPIELLQGDFKVDAAAGGVTLQKGDYLLSRIGRFSLDSDQVSLAVNALQGSVAGQGAMTVAIPANTLGLDATFQLSSKGEVRGEIRKPFQLQLAGATLDVSTATFEGDSLRIPSAMLNMPKGLGGSASVKDVRLTLEAPYVTIGDGRTSFALPTISIGGDKGFRLVELQATLEFRGEAYVFKGKGSFELPYTSKTTNGSASIGVTFELYDGKLRDVSVSFRGDGVRIPIGASGFALREVSGHLTLDPGSTVVQVEVDVVMEPKVEDVYPLSGRVSATFNSLGEVRLAGTVTALEKIEVGNAELFLSVPKRMASLKGSVNFAILQGDFNVTVWKDDRGRIHFTGRAVMAVTLDKGIIYHDCWKFFGKEICLDIPPKSMKLGEVGTEFGEFCTNRDCTATAWGFKGWVTVFKTKAGFYVDHRGKVAITNIDRYTLYPQTASARPPGLAAPSDTDLLPPVTVPANTPSAIFSLAWESGEPRFTIVRPDGLEIAPETQDPNVAYVPSPNQAFYGIAAPMPGRWQAKVSNVTGTENYLFSALGANMPPTIAVDTPTAREERGDPNYTIRWKASDPDDQAIVSLYYDTDNTDFHGILIAQGLPEEMTSYVWDTSAVPSGVYYIYAQAEDLRNPPVAAYSAGTVRVVNTTPPAAPTGIVITPSIESLIVAWTPNKEADLAGYRVHYGTTPTRYSDVVDVGATTSIVLSDLTPGATCYVAVSAYDTSGNESGLGTTASASPTSLTPPFIRAKINVDGSPGGIAADPETNLIFVANQTSDSIAILDGALDTLAATLSGLPPQPNDLIVHPVTGRLYVSHPTVNTLTAFDGLSGTGIGTISVGASPKGLAPLEGKIYVVNSAEATLSIVDAKNDSVIGTLPLGQPPVGIAANPQTERVYVISQGDSAVRVIDGATDQIVTVIPLERPPSGIAVNPRNNRIFIASESGQSIAVIDGNTNLVLANLLLGKPLAHAIVNPNTNHLFAISSDEGAVFVIDAESYGLLTTLSLGKGAGTGITISLATDRLYITNTETGEVTIIQDGATTLQPTPIRIATPVPIVTTTPLITDSWLYIYCGVMGIIALALIVVLAAMWRQRRAA